MKSDRSTKEIALKTRKTRTRKFPRKKNKDVLELSSIGADCEITHTGGIHVKGDIGDNVKINLTNGSLRVDGKIHDHVTINLIDSEREPAIGEFEVNRVPVAIQIFKKYIDISGNVGNHFKLNGAKSRNDVTLMANLGHESQIAIGAGNINVVKVGHDCHLETGQGEIRAFQVASGSKLIVAKKGFVEALRIQNHVSIHVPEGDIHLQRIGSMKHTTMFYDKQKTHVTLGGVDINEQIEKNAIIMKQSSL